MSDHDDQFFAAYILGHQTPRLTEATRNFQTDQGIGVDGKVGNNTRTAVAAAKAAAKAAAVATPPTVAASEGFFSNADAVALAQAQADAQVATQQVAPQQSVPSNLPVSFLQQETWSGGPTMGKTLTIGGLVLGGLGLVITLVKALRPAARSAPGMANRHNC